MPTMYNPEFNVTLCIEFKKAPYAQAHPAHIAPNKNILKITWANGKFYLYYFFELNINHNVNVINMIVNNAVQYVLPICILL